jgi:hypothetical protein
MKGKNIDLNDFNDTSAYNRALDSHRCEYCLQIFYHRFELSYPLPHFYTNGKFKWINICNSCRDQINTYELGLKMENERDAVEEVFIKLSPLTEDEDGEESSL